MAKCQEIASGTLCSIVLLLRARMPTMAVAIMTTQRLVVETFLMEAEVDTVFLMEAVVVEAFLMEAVVLIDLTMMMMKVVVVVVQW